MIEPCITIGSGLFGMGCGILELPRAGSHSFNACKLLLPLNALMFVDIYTDFRMCPFYGTIRGIICPKEGWEIMVLLNIFL
jgi:hypothetical protein